MDPQPARPGSPLSMRLIDFLNLANHLIRHQVESSAAATSQLAVGTVSNVNVCILISKTKLVNATGEATYVRKQNEADISSAVEKLDISMFMSLGVPLFRYLASLALYSPVPRILFMKTEILTHQAFSLATTNFINHNHWGIISIEGFYNSASTCYMLLIVKHLHPRWRCEYFQIRMLIARHLMDQHSVTP